MNEINEFLLTTCQSSLQWTSCLWDYKTGNVLQTYKAAGIAAQKTLNQIGKDYIIVAEQGKPLLHAFLLNKQEEIKTSRLILPDPANVLTVSPKNTYVAAGIGVKLYVWHLSSGKLLTVQQKHYQAITCIKFADTGDFLIVCGHDGIMVTYRFGDLISLQANYLPQSKMGQIEPLYTRLDHSMPIKDLHIGNFGFKSRIFTVSSDQTCKIYELHNGDLLLSLVFDEPLSSVVCDKLCWNLYIGCKSGLIREFSLKEPPREVQSHCTDGIEFVFKGHSKQVTCLTLNFTGGILCSGSEDCKVFLWEIKSRQILRAIEHKAIITNITFTLGFENFFEQNYKPTICLKSLERTVDLESYGLTVSILQRENDVLFEENDKETERENSNLLLEKEIEGVKCINNQLYKTMKFLIEKYYNV